LRWSAGKFVAGEAGKTAITACSVRLAEAAGDGEDLSVHAGALALAVLALAVAMILTPFAGLLMATVGLAALQTEGLLATVGAAIALSGSLVCLWHDLLSLPSR
jgi:hypothetical protein